MSFRIRVVPTAQADLTEAFAWYEKAQRGLGDRFLKSVHATLEAAARSPLVNRAIYEDVRRVLTPVSPYGLFYVLERDELILLGCFHARRDPSTWITGRHHRDP